mgnify:CR=1 FL=1
MSPDARNAWFRTLGQLALVLAAYVAGRVRQDAAPTVPVVLATVAACSFVGTSVFALSGLLLGDLAVGVPGEDLGSPVVGDAGGVNVLYGSSSGLTTTGDQVTSSKQSQAS